MTEDVQPQQPKKKEMTLEEKRKYNREATRKSREKKAQAALAASTQNQKEWWSKNVEVLKRTNPKQLEAWQEQEQRALDQLWWLRHGHEVPQDDPDFYDLEEGLADLERFIQEFGLLYSGYQMFEDEIAWKSEYWKNPEALDYLCSRSPATSVFARYGIVTALPDWRVREFKGRVHQGLNEKGEFIKPDRDRWLSGKRPFEDWRRV